MSSLEETEEIQQWIRQHAPLDAVLAPPPGHSGSWQVYSERACIMGPSFASYTSFSRKLALQVDDFLRRYPNKVNLTWEECVRVGSAKGADLIIVDDRDQVRRAGDPLPLYSAGHYHVLRASQLPNLVLRKQLQ
jgi:hypothetical protein